MDYESQSLKDKPFEGLSDDEKKHLFVYLCYVAHPRLTPEEIEKRWGRVLDEDKVPTVFEALEIANEMKQKVAPQDSQTIVPTPSKEASAWKTFAWILFVSGVVVAIALGVGEVHKAEMRKQEEMRIKKEEEMRIKKEEEMRKKEEQRKAKQQLRQETKKLINDANTLLSSTMASTEELLNMGLMLQALREKIILAQNGSPHSEQLVSIEELLLRCYKRARGKYAPERMFASDFSKDACYRISLLYMPRKHCPVCVFENQVTALSEDYDVAMKYLKEAAECDHYKALWLLCVLCDNDYREYERYIGTLHPTAISYDQRAHLQALGKKVELYRRQLANHDQATGGDVYSYARCISESQHDEALLWFKKAAKMGHVEAKKELLRKGLTFDE